MSGVGGVGSGITSGIRESSTLLLCVCDNVGARIECTGHAG